jgi:hypothetical protein
MVEKSPDESTPDFGLIIVSFDDQLFPIMEELFVFMYVPAVICFFFFHLIWMVIEHSFIIFHPIRHLPFSFIRSDSNL